MIVLPAKRAQRMGTLLAMVNIFFNIMGKNIVLLCNYFKLYHLTENDIDSLMGIMYCEINYVGESLC